MRALSRALLFCHIAGDHPSPIAPHTRSHVATEPSRWHVQCRCTGQPHALRAAYEGEQRRQRLLDKDKYDVNFRAEYGQTPLYTATLNNHPECMRKLIAAGAKLNLVAMTAGPRSWQPLRLASRS